LSNTGNVADICPARQVPGNVLQKIEPISVAVLSHRLYVVAMNQNKIPDIYTYSDFRKYLEDYRESRKRYDPGFTHTYICHRLGQRNSKSYFANVVNGVKTVTAEFANRFIELLELNADEAAFFRALVNYNQTYNPKEKEYYLDHLIRRAATQDRLILANEYAYYKEWHHSVVRAIIDIIDFKDDFQTLAKMTVPPITVREAKKSIRLLESMNLIKKDERGFFRTTEKTVKTDDYVHDDLIVQYQLKCLEIATMTLLSKTRQPHDVSTNVLSISEDGLKKIQKRLRKFREEVRVLVQNDDKRADRVYQLDIQLLPNSRIVAPVQIKKTEYC
jgi:uncharacterized protein (TIGR02147 family)